MSEYKTKIVLGVVLAVVIATGLAVASMAIAPNIFGSSTQSQHSTSQLSGPSVLLVQLTDPPIVPAGTTSLNLTYSSISLLVAEPSTTTETSTSTITSPTTSTTTTTITKTLSNVVNTPQSVQITPTGSVTVNLLKLQNISQTIASAKLPNGSTIYSVSFTVSSIAIAVNGVTYPVTLATGGSSLLVTMAKPAILEGTNAVLLDLTPTVVNTTSGYQMIPSSVGIIKPQSEITNQQYQIGHQDKLTDQEQQDIHNAAGQVTAGLTALSVSGSTTTISVRVDNTGNAAIDLVAIGIQGSFTAQNPSCTTTTTSTTTTSTTSTSDGDHQSFHFPLGCEGPFGLNEMVFVPASSTTTTSTTTTTTTSTSCSTGTMSPVDLGGMGDNNHLSLSPGQCVVLTFSGTITFGGHGVTLVPNTSSGQQYLVHVIGSDNAQMTLSCTLPASATSCTQIQNNNNYGQGPGQNYGQGQGQH